MHGKELVGDTMSWLLASKDNDRHMSFGQCEDKWRFIDASQNFTAFRVTIVGLVEEHIVKGLVGKRNGISHMCRDILVCRDFPINVDILG
jgi:hypothetical protein